MSPLLAHDVPQGSSWSVMLRAGRQLRLTALGDGANCSTVIFAGYDGVDRLNVPDTLKAQMSARVHAPMVLMSDRGIGLASVISSTLDWHDCITGHSLDAHVPPSSYAVERNGWKRSGRSLLVSELRKHGRDERDLHACVNFFSKVAIGPDGRLDFVTAHARAGDDVTLRAETDLLVVLATAPHPLDAVWSPAAVRAEVLAGSSYGANDASMTFRAESRRALEAAGAVWA
jgi:urea carboxylase-associated protein 2